MNYFLMTTFTLLLITGVSAAVMSGAYQLHRYKGFYKDHWFISMVVFIIGVSVGVGLIYQALTYR